MGAINVGKITEENRRRLETAETYEAAALSEMDPSGFSEELSRLIARKGLAVQHLVDITGLSKAYINKLRNLSGKPVQPGRAVVLNLALAAGATLEETNLLLKSAHYQELYARNSAESVIIWGLLHNLSGSQIRLKLSEMNLGRDILRQD